MDIVTACQRLFVGKVEQVRVSDIERLIKRQLTADEQYAYQQAGVFRTTLSVIYSFRPDVPAPGIIPVRPMSDLEIKAAKIKNTKPARKTVSTAVDELGLRISALGLIKVAELNGIDLKRYNHLDNGRRRMVVGNILRARQRKGKEVKLR